MNRILITGAAGNIGRTLRAGLRGRYPALRLSDIAPTLLAMLGLTKPAAMTGHSLLSPTAGRQAAD